MTVPPITRLSLWTLPFSNSSSLSLLMSYVLQLHRSLQATTLTAAWSSVLLALVTFVPGIAAVDPIVELPYATYEGVPLENGITQWLGMRFAAPPVGPRRFEPPLDPSYEEGVQMADKHGPVCIVNDSPKIKNMSEDCLFVNVFAPSGAMCDSQLPVFVYIQGGGFSGLSNQNYNGSGLVTAADHSIIVVTFNYRVGPFGFLNYGDSVAPNNGLRDQRKVLEWVSMYISGFGGNPEHVVIGGNSAGAASISLHLTAYGGIDMGLFHGVAGESVSFPMLLTTNEARYQVDFLAKKMGCLTGSTEGGDGIADIEVIECLRTKPAGELQAVHKTPYPFSNTNQTRPPINMWNPTIDGGLVPDVTYAALARGRFVNVPAIWGDVTNGGTVFTPRNTNSLVASNQFLANQFPLLTENQLNIVDSLFPLSEADKIAGQGLYWRQASNAYGELRYMCPTLFMGAMGSLWNMPLTYMYRWNVEDPDELSRGLGVPHSAEVSAIFGPEYSNGAAPRSYNTDEANAKVVPVTQAYWTSFIRTLNPNIYRHPDSVKWEPFSVQDLQRSLFNSGGETVMEQVDPRQIQRCQFFWEIGAGIRQ